MIEASPHHPKAAPSLIAIGIPAALEIPSGIAASETPLVRIQTIEDLELTLIEVPRPALFLAGKAFVRYRRQGGTKGNVLADFFIGAHAAVSRYPLLTRDTRRYTTYFSDVTLIAPDAVAPAPSFNERLA